eukprot:s49_g26.t1
MNFNVGDFGVAERSGASEGDDGEASPQRMVGSIHYLSPELCDGGRPTAAADCWALGVILYELCALELPFPGNNPLVVAMKILQGVVQPLSKQYSAELRSLCGALLCPAVKHRISAAEVSQLPWIRRVQRHEEVKPKPDEMETLKISLGSIEFERFMMAQLSARANAATEAASTVPAVCQAVDEASSACLDSCFSSLIRCCGSLSVLAPADDSCALQLLQKALRKVHIGPEACVLLKGNMRRLWRYPDADDWKIPQARLRGLLHSIFQVAEVSPSTSVAWAGCSGTRASLDFTILLTLVQRARKEKPLMPKKKRRKKRSGEGPVTADSCQRFYQIRDPINEEVDEALEALTAPSDEDLLLDEANKIATGAVRNARLC